MNKTLTNLFTQEDLEHSVLIGYYGGGNFGDELLLEVLMSLFVKHNVKSLTVTYQHPYRYSSYHHEFGYKRIDMADKKSVFKSIFKNKNVIIGGGGLWGLDVNTNVFILSSLLFFSRFILQKQIYLLGVGYYNSTSKLGHVSAWLAGKAANHIIVRDQESLQNFKKVSQHVSIDTDIAYQLPSLELKSYKPDLAKLNQTIPITSKTLFITLRRFKPNQNNHYAKSIETCLANNQDINIIVAIMEPRKVDSINYKLICQWQRRYKNIQTLDFTYNPIALFMFFRQHKAQIALIGPQFHAIVTALLTDVPFLPLVYDNKVMELLKKTTTATPIQINDMSQDELQMFIDNFKRITN